MPAMPGPLEIRPEIAEAVARRRPVVALESTLIAQGLPYPDNLETALGAEARVRAAGALPATVGIAAGRVVVGLSRAEIEAFATGSEVIKVSRRDMARAVAAGVMGATTVAATMYAARSAGITVLATGGIGGVHRGGENSLDVSADLIELGRTPVAVIASGAKSILDLPRTLEMLETQGVAVIGYRCDDFPAFYLRSSGLALEARVDTPAAAAAILRAQHALGLASGTLIANPPPDGAALDRDELEAWLAEAERRAAAEEIGGKSLTPFLLRQLFELSGGRTLAANRALIESNAALAAEIALELAAHD